MNQGQPDHRPALSHFHDWYKATLCPGKRCGDDMKFIPEGLVREYFRTRDRAASLLREQFRSEDLPCEPNDVTEKYPKVFCILLRIGKGRFIGYFTKNRRDDSRLPIEDPSGLPHDTYGESFFREFYTLQWSLIAPVFDSPPNCIFSQEYILPITYMEKIGTGGSANIFKVQLHSDHNKLDMPMTQSPSGPGSSKILVLKQYRSHEAEKYYNNEANAFRKLQKSGGGPHIVGFYGNFQQNECYNLIIEYADQGNLENYFRCQQNPQTVNDIMNFWTSLFDMINGLVAIHNLRIYGEGDGTQDQFFGWHQDFKPENILVMSEGQSSPYKWQFKLTDLGLAHFKLVNALHGDITDKDSHGTRAYGAPECYRPNRSIDSMILSVTPKVDIWSLGCILSETAVWVVRGWHGLFKYRERRRKAASAADILDGVECFHDGHKVLDLVKETHLNLNADMRRGDKITQMVYDKIIVDSLDYVDGRPDAKAIAHKAKRILAEVKSRCSTGTEYSGDGRIPPETPTSPRWPGSTTPYPLKPEKRGSRNSSSNTEETDYPTHTGSTTPEDLPPTRTNDGIDTTPVISPPVISRPCKFGSGDRSISNPSADDHELPDMDIKTVLTWKRERKSTKIKSVELKDNWLLSRLKNRDHVFLVDDTSSMSNHWPKVLEVFEALAYIIKDRDPDGFDIYFTNSHLETRSETRSRKGLEVLKKVRPTGMSNPELKLAEILGHYEDKLNQFEAEKSHYQKNPRIMLFPSPKPKCPRPLSLYILTDGDWPPGSELEKPIASVVRKLTHLNMRKTQCGIQFIRFGSNQRGKDALEYLDAKLELPLDIVDEEPATGNVWKMLACLAHL